MLHKNNMDSTIPQKPRNNLVAQCIKHFMIQLLVVIAFAYVSGIAAFASGVGDWFYWLYGVITCFVLFVLWYRWSRFVTRVLRGQQSRKAVAIWFAVLPVIVTLYSLQLALG